MDGKGDQKTAYSSMFACPILALIKDKLDGVQKKKKMVQPLTEKLRNQRKEEEIVLFKKISGARRLT